jgi:hypothetical protein
MRLYGSVPGVLGDQHPHRDTYSAFLVRRPVFSRVISGRWLVSDNTVVGVKQN